MLRAAIIFLAIPTVCDPPAEPPPYTCRSLPEELDFGEVQTFTRQGLLNGLDNRDQVELGALAPPFSAQLITRRSQLSLLVEFKPIDAQLHFDELRVRLAPTCEEQTIRLVGRGSGALETPNVRLSFGEGHRFEPVSVAIPLVNTRREPIDVSSTISSVNRVELDPPAFSLQPVEHREVNVRVTCLRDGPIDEFMSLVTVNQTLQFSISGTCLP